MSQTTLNKSTELEIALSEIDERYGALRLISPAAEKQMLHSISKYGQLAPVVVNHSSDTRYEMVDGFKRLRALTKLEAKCIRARVVDMGTAMGKAAVLQLNWSGKTVTELEEALVVQALCREDGLQQKQIAVLLSRHESWVSRRLSLVERLGDEVREAIRLGLVSVSSARELAKLPRGNQQAALDAISKHRLTFRETARLVTELLAAPRWNHEQILRCAAILEQRTPPSRPGRAATPLNGEAQPFEKRLLSMARTCLAVAQRTALEPASLGGNDRFGLGSIIDQAIAAAESAVAHLKKYFPAQQEPF